MFLYNAMLAAAAHDLDVGMGNERPVRGELIKFLTKDRIILHGFFIRSRGSKTCIVHVHGMMDGFYSSDLPLALAKEAGKKGISTFIINTRGHDAVASIDKKKGKKIVYFRAGTNFEKFEDCLIDIAGAIETLESLGFKKFILSGHSTGCQKVTHYQYKTENKNVKALVLFAPADDYNINKKEQGKKFNETVRFCKRMVRKRRGNETDKRIPSSFSAKRFLSIADPNKNVEARVFNYDGDLKEFSEVTVPICALFGSREQYAVKPVKKYLEILKSKSKSRNFTSSIIKGARHGFRDHENETSAFVTEWLSGLGL